jgi:hypothetical protein
MPDASFCSEVSLLYCTSIMRKKIPALPITNPEAASVPANLWSLLQFCVRPAYIMDQSGKPVRIGSLTLITLGDQHFALTAGHVLEALQGRQLWTAAARDLVTVNGKKFYLNKKTVDLGIVAIRPSYVENLLSDLKVLPLGNLHIFEGIDPPSSLYVMSGFPASKAQSKINHKTGTVKELFRLLYTVPSRQATYDAEGLSEIHVVLDWNHKLALRADGLKVTPPKLQGSSGGGVFKITPEYKVELVGIATDHRRSSRIIVGTRIHAFIAFLIEQRWLYQESLILDEPHYSRVPE